MEYSNKFSERITNIFQLKLLRMREYSKKGWAKPAVNVINIFTYKFFIRTSISEAFSSYMHIEKLLKRSFFPLEFFSSEFYLRLFYIENKNFFPSQKTSLNLKHFSPRGKAYLFDKKGWISLICFVISSHTKMLKLDFSSNDHKRKG
jgi:hypothetical protein